MAAWLPLLKAALPYLGDIVAAARPVFTSRREADASADLVSRQIAELQDAVSGNAETLKGLAARVEQAITAIASGETELEQQLTSLREALARREESDTLLRDRITRLEELAAALHSRADQAEARMLAARRRELAVTALTGLALLLALLAYLG